MNINKRWKLIVIIGICLLLYVPSLGQFFSADDWFHLRVSKVASINDWFHFFSFVKNSHSISFYRPLSTQVFFGLFYKLFGLNAWPWYLFGLSIFGLSLALIYRFVELIGKFSKDLNVKMVENLALLTTFFYGLSVTNFTKLYFVSIYQELFMVVFVLGSLIFYLQKKYFLSWCLFVLGLMSKETAMVLPGLLVLLELFRRGSLIGLKKMNFRLWRVYVVTLLGYLSLRLIWFGAPVGDSYGWNVSVLRMLNTIFWYGLWSLGAPEFLVDYVRSGLRIVPRFWMEYPVWGWFVLSGLGVLMCLGILMLIKILIFKKGEAIRWLVFIGFWFLLSLLPVLFWPNHKFVLELTLPMVGVSLGLAWLVLTFQFKRNSDSRNTFKLIGFCDVRWLSLLFVSIWFVYNLGMNYLTYKTNYSVSRSVVARRIYTFLEKNYLKYPNGKYFLFVNDTDYVNDEWGSSKQINLAISGSDMFRVLYDDPQLRVYYEDSLPDDIPEENRLIRLSSKIFLKD